MKSLIVIAMTLSPLLATAQFDVRTPRGEKMVQFQTPQSRREICVLPQHSALGKYSEKDLEEEKELCSYDFHGLTSNPEFTQMALCPKLNSTNPGVLAMKIPSGWTRNKFEAEKCLVENDLQSTEAKFKQTVTCSYTPAILSYYHFSRMLGGAGRVPVAVLRTMFKERHLEVAKQGLVGTQKVGGAIRKGWEILVGAHQQPTSTPLLFDRTGEFMFGALQANVKNEEKYYEIIGGGQYEDRYKNFLKKDFYTHLRSTDDILNVLGSRDFKKVAQQILALKDATDMILLDTLLTQQDRMYNQHFKWAWTWIENDQIKSKRLKAKQNDKGIVEFKTDEERAEKAKYEEKGAIMVKELIMKDNDCAVRARFYRNRMKEVQALDKISHISGATYTAFLKLARSLEDPSMISYLKNETLMTDADIKLMMQNVSESEQTLKARCRSGALKLDLDLETHFTSRAPQYRCDI